MKSVPLLDSDSIRQWVRVHPLRNLGCLAMDYAVLALVQAALIYSLSHLDDWGLSKLWAIPIGMVGVVLTGCIIHRIGLMGHEASHHMLVTNRMWNDILADLLCFYPLWSSLTSYRAKHLGHHLYPNDPEKDPNWAGGKGRDLFARFPMPKPSFIYQYYVKFFWPPFVFKNLYDLLRVLSVGSGMAPVDPKELKSRARKFGKLGVLASPTIMALIFLVVLVGIIYASEATGKGWLVITAPILFYLAGVAIWSALPKEQFKRSSAKLSYDAKISGLIRFTFYTVTFLIISWIRFFGNFDLAPFYACFWIFPLIYVFPYLMLLREIYQHANLGTGQLDNSRIIHADPFTCWALLGYGNDYHLIHHIYPNIPHYHLPAAHEKLVNESEVYRESVEESYGTFQSRGEQKTLLDHLARPPATSN